MQRQRWINEPLCRHLCNVTVRKTNCLEEKCVPVLPRPPNILTWTDLGSNPFLRSERPAPYRLHQCFSTAGPRPGTGPWHQLYRAARGSPGICHFNFLSNFHEQMFYSGNILKKKNIRECVEKLRPRCWPDETTICYRIH